MSTIRKWIILVALLSIALLPISCVSSPQPVVQTVVVPATPQVVVATPTPEPKEIVFMAGWGGGGRELLEKIGAEFTARTGITVSYEESRQVQALVRTRIAGGNPPDVVLETRPGVIAELARQGHVIPLDQPVGKEVIDPAVLAEAYSPSFLDLARVDGLLYGFPFKADSKSTFFYDPGSFEEVGVEPPATWDEMLAVADEYVASGKVPFAIAAKDGWTLTDWFENIYVRVATPEMYNGLFVSHSVPWTDPSVKLALTYFGQIFDTDGYLPGGKQGALGTGFVESIGQVFGADPVAAMTFEGAFVGTIVLNEVNPEAVPGEDIDFFLFPEIDADYGAPVVGGGDYAILLKDTPEGREFMRFLSSKEAAELLATGREVAPHKLVDPAVHESYLARKQFEQLLSAPAFVYDGSDLAPGALGGDFLFTKLQDLALNPGDVDRIANELEDFAQRVY